MLHLEDVLVRLDEDVCVFYEVFVFLVRPRQCLASGFLDRSFNDPNILREILLLRKSLLSYESWGKPELV